MIVHIYTRHARDCSHADDPQYKRCRCPRWVHYTWEGRQHRESTGKRSWEQATVYARGVELRFERIAAGEKPKPTEPMTVAGAVSAYLEDKRSQHLSPETLYKITYWFNGQLQKWCAAHGVYYLHDLDLNHLRQWRATWKDGSLTSQKKQERVRGFLNFCQSSGWIQDNPSKGLSKIKVAQQPTGYFTEDEFDKIVAACQSSTTRALVLLMRWSGLSIRDAVTLERERLNAENQIFLYRAKTGTAVHVTIPPDVADEMRAVKSSNERYFFWTGSSTPRSASTMWQKVLRKLFRTVNLRHPDGKKKRAHPHMFRDTFAVQLLLCGVPLHDVAMLLGHTSIKTTEKHYAPFVMARMEQLDASVKAAWEKRV